MLLVLHLFLLLLFITSGTFIVDVALLLQHLLLFFVGFTAVTVLVIAFVFRFVFTVFFFVSALASVSPATLSVGFAQTARRTAVVVKVHCKQTYYTNVRTHAGRAERSQGQTVGSFRWTSESWLLACCYKPFEPAKMVAKSTFTFRPVARGRRAF